MFRQFLLLLCFRLSYGGNILVFQAIGMRSNLHSMASVLEELTPYHNITFYLGSGVTYQHPNMTVKRIVSHTASDALRKNKVLSRPCELDTYQKYLELALHTNQTMYTKIYEDHQVQDLLQSTEKFDLVIVSGYVSEHFFPFVEKFNAPVIQLSPSIMLPWAKNNVGSPQHWDYDISFFVTEKSNSFIGRLKKYVKNAMAWYRYYNVVLPTMDEALSRYFSGASPVEKLSSMVQMTFLNTHSAMGFGAPPVPTLVEVGGLNVKAPKPLPEDLKAFLDSAVDGVIYFSLGSVMPESTMSDYVRNSLLKTFGSLKQKVLWKIDGDKKSDVENVVMSKWFPQQSILNHPNTRLSIMPGGMLSLTESVSYGVPVLVMPILFDQIGNSYVVEEVGYGQKLDFCEFTHEKFSQKVNELLHNPRYRQKAQQISQILKKDIPRIKRDVRFWVDFVIQYKNTSVLNDLKVKRSWMETMPADIFIALFLIFVVTASAVVSSCFLLRKTFVKYQKSLLEIKNELFGSLDDSRKDKHE